MGLLPGWLSYCLRSYMTVAISGSKKERPSWATNTRSSIVRLRKTELWSAMKSTAGEKGEGGGEISDQKVEVCSRGWRKVL